jgi:hypothetical protein
LHNRIISAVKRIEFVWDRMSYIILKGRWYQIIVLNVHVPTEHVFDKFSKYHMNILLGDFNAKVGKEYIFKLTVGMKVYTKLIMVMELQQ